MKSGFFTFIIGTTMVLSSCERAIFEEDLAATDPMVNFDYLSTQVREKYAFIEYKNIDLEALRSKYRAQINSEISQDSFFWVCADYLNELRDGHVNLISNFNISRYPFQRLGPPNYNARLIEDHYLSERSYRTGPFIHDFLADSTVGYIRYDSFSNAVTTGNLDFVLKRYANTNGLIFDIRENGGGQTRNGWRILQRFIEQSTPILLMRTKNGPYANDFTPFQTQTIERHKATTESPSYHKKVVILIDRGSYSASSIFALGATAIPNVTLIGDTTGGGTGLPNGGQLPNGWRYRMSVSQTVQIGTLANYEDGVPPDIYAIMDHNAPEVDEVIERGIQYINN